MTKVFPLINVDEGVHSENFFINRNELKLGDTDWNVRMQRLRGGLSEGVDVIRIDNGCTQLAVLPTRGMGIWKGEVDGVPVRWESPVERPVHPAFVDQSRRGGIGWLDGFNELVCRCGLGWHGAPGNDGDQFLPLHGRIANLPAHNVRLEVSDDGELSLIGVVDESSMFGGRLRLTSTLKTRIGSNSFEIHDEVTNLGSTPADVEMLYHCNFGRPILGDGATLHMAAEEVAPRNERAADGIATWPEFSGPESGFAEQVYFAKPISDDGGRGLAVLSNSEGDNAVALRFDTKALPWFVLWKNTQAVEDGYCTGLEPGSSLPNGRAFEREHGRVISLASASTVALDLSFSVATDKSDVERLVAEVAALQSGQELTVHKEPKSEWSE